MSLIPFQITPFTGIGLLRLGMVRPEVRLLLGASADVTTCEHSKCICWRYTVDALALTFSADDDYRLGTITCESSSIELMEHALVGESEQVLQSLGSYDVLAGLVSSTEVNGRTYDCDRLGLGFWVVDFRVENVTIYPRYEADGDTIVWPHD